MKITELLNSVSKQSKGQIITDLKIFNQYWDSVEDKGTLLTDLLEASPKCEILLGLFDLKGLLFKDCPHVFTALGSVLLTIASEIGKPDGSNAGNRTQLASCAQEIMQTLLQKHTGAFAKTLFTRNEAAWIVPTLRCLTAGVLACEASAAEVVSSLDWSQVGLVIDRRDPNPLIDPRTWCCYLYTAIFEMHTNETIFEQFLRSGALKLLYGGLQYDSPELIVSILTKLREKVLFNNLVNKRIKVQLFNGSTMEPIVALHRWPNLVTADYSKHAPTVPEDPDELEQAKKNITEALTKFLKPLCSSYKFGIAFAGTDNYLPNNGHALTVIKNLTVFAFVDPAFRDVVSSTLVACPDILPGYALSIKSSFDISPSKYFFGLIQVYIDIVGKVNIAYVVQRDPEFILKLLLPVPLSGNYVHSMVKRYSEDLTLKTCGLRLLEKILTTSEKVVKGLLDNSYRMKANRVEKAVQEFLQKAVTDIDEIMSLWSHVNQDEDTTDADTEKLLLVVKVLSLYARFLPSPDLNSIIKPDQLLAATIRMVHLREDNKLQLLIACLHLINTLQSKFDVLTQARDELMQKDLLDTFKLLLSLYLDGMKVAEEEGPNSMQKNILLHLVEHIEKTLVNYGFSSHSEANIQFWLEALVGQDEACIDFLCQSIVATIASLEHYSDQVVVITRNTALEQAIVPSDLSTTLVPGDAWVVDNTDIVSANVPLSFSRLILGNLELLAKNKSATVSEYFCHVIERYIRHLPDPQVLAQYLLTDAHLCLPGSLAECCRCWLGQKPVSDQLVTKGETIAERMQYVFQTKDYHYINTVIEDKSSLPVTFEKRQEVVKATLLYLQVDTSETANVQRERAVDAYIKVLQHLIIDECINLEEGSNSDLCNLALNHYALMKCNPFVPGKLPTFVTTLLRRVTDDAEISNAVPLKYFKQYCQKLALILSRGQVDVSLDFWFPFEPLMNRVSASPESVISLLEILFTFSELFVQSASILKLSLQALNTLKTSSSGSTSQDSKLHAHLYSTLNKYASVITSEAEPNEDLLTVLIHVWDFLADALQPSDAAALDHGKLKSLISLSQPLGGTLLLRALQLHPSHAAYIIKRITRTGPVLPGHASVVLFLLQLPETSPEFVQQMLEAVKATIVAWLKVYDAVDQPGYHGLAALLIARNMIGGGEMSSIVKSAYGRMVEEGDAPSEHFATICLVCVSLKGHKKESRLPCPDALVSTLHFLLCYVEKKLSRHATKQQSRLLSEAVQHLLDLLPKLHRRTRPDRAQSDIWLKFVKKVIKTSLRDCSELSAQVVACLGPLCEWQYSVPEGGTEQNTTTKPLSMRDLHSLLVTHARYDNLMMRANTDPQLKLKEVVLELQCTLLRLCPAVARDLHVSKILAAYNATTQPHDQAALQLLKQYEETGGLEQLLPVIWGDAAVPYYGVGSVMPVFREPRPEQVLVLYDSKMLMNTCINYERSMSSKASVRCALPSPSVGPVYDLRYLLPSLVYVARKYHSFKAVPDDSVLPQMVAVALAALAAEDLAIRSQAVKLIRILRLVLERISLDRLRLFWTWLLDIVCYTIAASAATTRQALEKVQKSKRPSSASVDSADVAPTNKSTSDSSLYTLASVAPLAGPFARFMMETVMTTENPRHPLYTMLMNYMFLFPYMRTNKIPEMQRLYHNSSPQHSVHAQLLLLRMLSQGVRTTADFALVQRVHVLPLILSLLHSPTATHQIQLEAVEVLTAMVAISAGCNRLLRHHELLQLLPSLVERCSVHDASSNHARRELVGSVVQLLNVAWTRQEQDCSDGKAASGSPEQEGNGVQAKDEDSQLMEGDGDYEGYDDGFYDEGYDDYEDDYYSDEEKSKVRKKRKLEARNKKAAKKAKLEENGTQRVQVKNVVKMDTVLVGDFIQCLMLIASRVFQTKDAVTIEKLQTLTASIGSYVNTKVSARKTTLLLTSTLAMLVKHVTACERTHQSV